MQGIDITPLLPSGRQLVETYGEGRFRVSGQIYPHSVLVFPEKVLAWAPSSFEQVTVESLAAVTANPDVELLILGCGERQGFITPSFRHALKLRGVVVEGMATGAACRTYNVLMAEERRVAAALIAVS